MMALPASPAPEPECSASGRPEIGYLPLKHARIFPEFIAQPIPEFRLISVERSKGILPTALQSLTPAEEVRARRFIREEDHDRFVLGRFVTRSMLAQLHELNRSDIQIGTTSLGRPFVPSRPDIVFSIAHSGDLVLVGMGSGFQIGVDVQQHLVDIDFDAVANLVFAARELTNASLKTADSQFFRQWCLKEAIAKALGTGFAADPRRFAVSTSGPPAVSFVGEGADDVGGGWTITEFDVGEGYCAAATWRNRHYAEVKTKYKIDG